MLNIIAPGDLIITKYETGMYSHPKHGGYGEVIRVRKSLKPNVMCVVIAVDNTKATDLMVMTTDGTTGWAMWIDFTFDE